MRFLINLRIDGWLIGVAAIIATIVCVRRRELGFVFIALAVCASFISRAVTAWLFTSVAHTKSLSTPSLDLARVCEIWVAPVCFLLGFALLAIKKRV